MDQLILFSRLASFKFSQYCVHAHNSPVTEDQLNKFAQTSGTKEKSETRTLLKSPSSTFRELFILTSYETSSSTRFKSSQNQFFFFTQAITVNGTSHRFIQLVWTH